MATKPNNLELTPKQRHLAEKLANPDFTGTVTELCRQCNVARSTFYKWMDKREFLEYLNELIQKYSDSELANVWKALIRKCAMGDVQAIKLYFELRERANVTSNSGVQIIDDV